MGWKNNHSIWTVCVEFGQFLVFKLTDKARYVLSYLYTRILHPFLPYLGQTYICSTFILRSLNALGVTIAIPLLAYQVSRRHQRTSRDAASDAVSVGFFPLLFFFAGLFYTDVWSSVFLLAAYDQVLVGNSWISAAVSVSETTVEIVGAKLQVGGHSCPQSHYFFAKQTSCGLYFSVF